MYFGKMRPYNIYTVSSSIRVFATLHVVFVEEEAKASPAPHRVINNLILYALG